MAEVLAIYIKEGGLQGKLMNVIDYDASLNRFQLQTLERGRKFYTERENFIVKGDIISLYENSRYNDYLVDSINKLSLTDDFFFYQISLKGIGNLDSILNKNEFFDKIKNYFRQKHFYNLQELFNNPQVAPEKIQKGSIEEIENQIVSLNQDISDLNSLKSFMTPLQFEEKIKISSEIDSLQKEVGKKIFDITEAEVKEKSKSGSIIESLFENSFKGISRNYEIETPTEQENPDFFAPDGKPSRLSDSINFIIRSPQFKSWFGDWQLAYQFKDDPDYQVPCSKIVLENGEPEIYWHGTGVPFSYFKFDMFPAAYFAKKKEYSQFFSQLHGGEEGGYLLPFFLNVRNPLDLRHFGIEKITPEDFFEYIFVTTGMDESQLEANPLTTDSSIKPMETWIYLRNNSKMLKIISTMYDGILYFETNPNVKEGLNAHSTEAVIVFSPHQIKLASEDRSLFILSSLRSFILAKGGKI